MAVTWTKEQQKVIDTRKRNLLVSAAAGSGKTAVLVERIITRLTKDTPPIDVDQLLVVTYTEAAAAEMKERIGLALEKALEEEPENQHLKKQTALLHTAKIMTIHSFCLSVIREYFHTIDLDPGFRVAEEGELKLLKMDVMEQMLEEKYEEGDPEFLQFVETFATGRDDAKLEELILKLYEFAGAYPDAESWLDACAEVYRHGMDSKSIFMKKMLSYIKNSMADIEADMCYAMKICQQADGPYAYEATIEKDQQIFEVFKNAADYEAYQRAFEKLEKWPRLAANKDKSVNEEKIARVKVLRDGWKTKISDIQKDYFSQDKSSLEADMELCYPVMKILTGLVKEFGSRFLAKKTEKNLIDFHDMEQFALQILTRKEDEKFYPSEVAKEYQDQFEEIMIDEYQDSNLLQETILTSVSRMDRGENNLFMVGDVKQSIYRFRLSRPELFMEKYDTYTIEESNCQRIDLHKNFRSRAEVLDAANAVFRQIMTKELGGIAYDENAALYVGADYPQIDGKETELLVIDTDVDVEGTGVSKVRVEEARTLEARAIAERIHGLMEEQQIWDRKEEVIRPLKYSDIVILSRSLKGYTEVFTKVLAEEGIPMFAESQEGYFETLEISWMLDYLRVLDNYRQDIPLAAVLKSPFGRCTNEELAQIRMSWEDVPFHEAVLRTCGVWWGDEMIPKKTIPETTLEKVRAVFNVLEGFRKEVPYTSIQDLLWKIMKETGYRDYVSAMPGGEQRAANLEMLLVKAKAFEKTSYKGLFHFVRYMDQMKKYELDMGEAGIFDEQMDAVRLMSIHKSKGLEFPVVIVVGMGKRFNMQDVKGSVISHPELGLGMDAIDVKRRTKSTTIVKKVIQTETKLENLGEELRVLYVAMTRAKEKLILAGTCTKTEKLIKNEKKTLTFTQISEASSYYEWVLAAAANLSENLMKIRVIKIEDIVSAENFREEADILEKRIFLKDVEMLEQSPEFAEKLKEQFTFAYAYDEEQVKLKYSVSELKKRAALETSEWEAGEAFIKEETETIVPQFVEKQATLTGASRGSAYHKVMELLDFSREYQKEDLEEELKKWEQEGYMDKEMSACIQVGDILEFLESSVGKRMHRAACSGKLFKEQPFVMGVDAKEIYPETEVSDFVLIQGIIDVFFEEDGELVVLDYKTDKIWKAEELVLKYQEQLHLYGKALTQMARGTVKEKIIYSFTLKKEIRI